MLRHGCGYALANAGHDTRALQALGQGNIQHTVRCAELAPNDPEPAVSWLSGFRRGAHARPKTTPVHYAARRRRGDVALVARAQQAAMLPKS
jgi:type 1 fimbriae regulatory protein FimB/type 1 fimbriae regulatory protein FimE